METVTAKVTHKNYVKLVGLADRAMKTQIKKALRGRLNRARQAIKKLAEPDFYRPVLLKCVRHLRFTSLARGLAPFELGGLQMVQQLTTLEASLCRAQEKGGVGCLIA